MNASCSLPSSFAILRRLPQFYRPCHAAALTERFRNPTIAHETFQIAMDGTQTLPQPIFQPVLATCRQDMTSGPSPSRLPCGCAIAWQKRTTARPMRCGTHVRPKSVRHWPRYQNPLPVFPGH
ncbi:MAG: hypothetical protein KIT21_18470 [Shinella sp.]|nr:hypothetical protein [Shinella sp.]